MLDTNGFPRSQGLPDTSYFPIHHKLVAAKGVLGGFFFSLCCFFLPSSHYIPSPSYHSPQKRKVKQRKTKVHKNERIQKLKEEKKVVFILVNDPSAGSPTETLLRLLLPLNVKVYATFPFQRMSCPMQRNESEEFTGTFNR